MRPSLPGVDTTLIANVVRDVLAQDKPKPPANADHDLVTADKLVTDDIRLADGTRQPRVFTRALTKGPPPKPRDGDIWIATGAGGNGETWQFRYNVHSTVAYKWEFIGGSAINADVDTNQSTASTSTTDLGTVQSLTMVRAGDYRITFGFQGYNSVNTGGIFAEITKAGVVQMDIALTPPGVNAQMSGTRVHGINVAANDVLKMQYRVGSGTGNFLSRFFGIVPLRIS